jgi:GntR family transcriptional regulator, galactonate operon transcriptional repressor
VSAAGSGAGRQPGSRRPRSTMRGQQGKVLDALGRAIVGGRYQPGDLLPREAELAEQHAVSRTSVRSAMKVLAAKGMVDIRQKVGTRIRPQELWNTFDSELLSWYHAQGLGETIMQDLVELRQILEPSAARLAASRASMGDLRRLRGAQAEMAANTGDHDGYAASDVEFHMAVYMASHNALLQRFGLLVADFMHLTFAMQQEALGGDPSAFRHDAARHTLVFDAIDRGDAAAAGEAMLAVVLEGKSALIDALARPRSAATDGSDR